MIKTITIKYKGVDLNIEYLFQPKELSNGIGATIEEITSIKMGDTCLYELLENEIQDLVKAISKQLK